MKKSILLVASCGLAAGCATMGISGGPSAVANLEPTNGNSAKGTVTFTQHGDKVRVSAQLTNDLRCHICLASSCSTRAITSRSAAKCSHSA